jgi:hypothetical protein
MSYWVPSAILGFVLLVLIAQLPWRSPGRRADSRRVPLNLGNHANFSGSVTSEEDTTRRDTAALSKS